MRVFIVGVRLTVFMSKYKHTCKYRCTDNICAYIYIYIYMYVYIHMERIDTHRYILIYIVWVDVYASAYVCLIP